MLLKNLYAFLYQEQFVPFLDNSTGIWFGATLLATMNYIFSFISGFDYSADDVKNSLSSLYPGHDQCKYEQAHSIWHEESSSGLLELVYVADYLNFVTYSPF